MKASTTIVFLAVLVGCQLLSKPVKLEPALIRPYSVSDGQREPFAPPYIATYVRDAYTLVFIASDHGAGIDTPLFKTIKSVIDTVSPQILILEGFPDEGEISPEPYKKWALECKARKFFECGETSFSASLAIEKSIPFVSGEPTESEVASRLESKGYTKQDFLGFSLISYIAQWRRQGVLQENTLDKKIGETALTIQKDIGANKSLSLKELKDWYLAKTNKTFDISKIDSGTVSPRVDVEVGYLNRLSHHVGVIRETHLVNQVNTQFRKYKRIVVIYGQGHLVKQRQLLKEAFGPPRDTKIY